MVRVRFLDGVIELCGDALRCVVFVSTVFLDSVLYCYNAAFSTHYVSSGEFIAEG